MSKVAERIRAREQAKIRPAPEPAPKKAKRHPQPERMRLEDLPIDPPEPTGADDATAPMGYDYETEGLGGT